MDYSICHAFSYRSEGLPGGLEIYDIGCQWCKTFHDRMEDCPHLLLPQNILNNLIVAVGSFHLSAHIQECFALYSLHFVEGIGQVDGEILETLWAPYNEISPMCRVMTASQRREVYDDFMRDSNWKKMIGMGTSIIDILEILALILWRQ